MMSRPEAGAPGSPSPHSLLPTEQIGSIPRPPELLEGMQEHSEGRLSDEDLQFLFASAIRDTIARLEATGSRVISDGEQTKPSFATYPIAGLDNLMPDGVTIPFADGHVRQLPRLAAGPFRYQTHAGTYLDQARKHARVAVKQAVIAPSALSLLYPAEGIAGYPQKQFIEDLLREHETEMRRCLQKGAHKVQIDFTEARLAVKIDPSGQLLDSFIDLNNLALSRFSPEERKRIGVHTWPGGDLHATHSAEVDYADLLPKLFELKAGNFYIALACERDRPRVLKTIRKCLKPGHRIFIGVTSPIEARIETAEEVRDRVLEASEYIPVEQLGTTDDCGFAPFSDDTSTSRDTAFAKIRARVLGTALAENLIGVGSS